MKADRTIIDRFADLGVELNGLIIPGASVDAVLGRHAFNLFVHNDHDLYKVSLIGSATAIRYRKREFLLTTQHQLRGIDLPNVAMMTDTGSHVITSAGSRHFEPRSDTDAYDITAFEFTEPCAAYPELKRRFFNLRRVPNDVLNIDVIGFLLTGFPSKAQAYEIADKNHIGVGRLAVVCTLEPQPNDPALLCVKAVSPLDLDPDGMSGGSAFVIQMQDGRPQAFFAGIIIRGGLEHFYVLKSGFVRAFLDACLERSVESGR
ncbi:MAG: hypothetical protein J0I31_12145 [Rhizobiales bacterium]|nr:hypothetical protein [Hyphomicrobiales bacterium]